MIHIVSYRGVDNLIFDQSTKDDAIDYYGVPVSKNITQLGVIEYIYDYCILRFNPNTSLFIEYTLLPYMQAVVNNEVIVTWDKEFLQKLYLLDSEPKDAYGFIVFSKLGLAVTGIHDNDESQLAITGFRKNELTEFLVGSCDFYMKIERW